MPTITLFLCGDVMTGRGVDQIMAHPGESTLHESYIRDAGAYVKLAERAGASVPRRAEPSWIWGDALDELRNRAPDVRIINLETAVTRSNEYWPGKEVHYRMHPANAACLTAAGIDCCGLANNHVLDWGFAGLEETLQTLRSAGVPYCGAGRDLSEARSPVIRSVRETGRVVTFSFGSESSGIPAAWAAGEDRPGVNLIDEASPGSVRQVAGLVETVKQSGDIVVVSIHWGGNWGYEISRAQREFARALVDLAGVDVVHGHSSHHVKGVEVYKDKLILYGCGDFLTDYEGISGYEQFRGNLGLMYFVTMDPASGRIVRMEMVPTRVKGFRVNRAGEADAEWLDGTLRRESSRLGTPVQWSEGERILVIE